MCNLIITIQCLFTLFIYEIPFCRKISLHAGSDANIDFHHIFLFTEYSLMDRPPLPHFTSYPTYKLEEDKLLRFSNCYRRRYGGSRLITSAYLHFNFSFSSPMPKNRLGLLWYANVMEQIVKQQKG